MPAHLAEGVVMVVKCGSAFLVFLVVVSTAARPGAQSAPASPAASASSALSSALKGVEGLEGMWSNPPVTALGALCAFFCTDAGIDRLNALMDDPANDKRPFGQLMAEASSHQRDNYIRPRLTPAALKTYPLDPADDPGLLRCEPWGLARQMVAPHQIEIRRRGNDRIELHYGEWDARRTVYMDGRTRAANQAPSRLGYSVGRWERDALVVETSGVAANQTSWRSEHSDQLRVVERFTRSAEGNTLLLTATMEDPWSLREPLVVKKMWAWAPKSQIAPYVDCEPVTAVKRGTGQP